MKSLLFFGIITILFSCSGKKEYTILGNIEGLNDKNVIIFDWNGTKYVPLDTVRSQTGTFTLKGSVEFPKQYYLKMEGAKSILPIFVENSTISIKGSLSDLRKITITGSESENFYTEFLKTKDALFKSQLDSLNDLFSLAEKTKDDVLLENTGKQYDSIQALQNAFILDLAKKNNKTTVSPFIILNTDGLLGKVSNADLRSVLDHFDVSIYGSTYFTELKTWLTNQERVAIGRPFVNISMPDTTGNVLSLSAFKGKWILLDFWSSKCGPCRIENPNLVKLYTQYKSKGFEIFSVSFDSDKKEWKKAMATDGVIWTQVSALTGWQNDARANYCVEGIPHSVLINPEGIIVEKNLRGDQLKNKLEKIFQ